MRAHRPWAVTAVAALLAVGLSACGGNGAAGLTNAGPKSGDTSAVAATSQAQIVSSVPADATGVQVNRSVRLDVTDGTLTTVGVTGPNGGQLKGVLSTDKSSWQSVGRLRPGTTYQVHGVAVDAHGIQKVYNTTFRTQVLSKNRLTYPSFFPLPGSTVGIGMPVVIRFDVPVTDHASIQQHLQVTSVPAQAGAWHWISNTEVHWRPKNFWKPHTKVTVHADIASIPAGDDVYGQVSRTNTFSIGRSMISKVDIRTDQMKVYRDGTLIKTIPITTGRQPEFTTRSGIKVIVEKDRYQNMNSETIGINPNGPGGYNLKDVEYAMRLTYSGEFIHAAPWSVGSQGYANVSHGCTGMSTENAGWMFYNSIIGDVVEYTGSNRPMTLTNGLGDWNLSFAQYAQG
jgi:lipoprotein-anchoring transpeptidase ErfK/SrfK